MRASENPRIKTNVYIDDAQRYVRMFGGKIEIDSYGEDFDAYLCDVDRNVIARVSYYKRFCMPRGQSNPLMCENLRTAEIPY